MLPVPADKPPESSLTSEPASSHKILIAATVSVLLTAHAGLLAWSAWLHSPVDNEVAHLASGMSHLELGRFDLYRVNPPLVRVVSTLPVLLASPKMTWRSFSADPLTRAEVLVGQDFLFCNGSRSYWLVTLARWGCIPLSLLGGYVCFRWAGKLFGTAAGLLAASLWCFSPYVLGHSSLITPDAHAAALGLTAAYCFWRWLKRPNWGPAALAGLALGLAQLAKFTLLAFYPTWLLLWILYRLPERREMGPGRWLREAGMVLLLMAASVVVVNAGYCFEGTFQRLGDFRFQSLILAKADSRQGVSHTGGNRFADTWLRGLPVPVPRNYLQGIDTQKSDLEGKKWSYLRGRWRMGGWWYYYLYAWAVKVPLGTWALLLLALVVSIFRGSYNASRRDELVLLLPPLVVLTLVSSQTGFSVHSRYVLPALPFAFVWISKAARAASLRHWVESSLVCMAVCWSVISSLSVYPHSFGYFNELVGGPARGHAHLLGGDTAWGQDLLLLKAWLDDHPEARPLGIAVSTAVDPRLLGIEFVLPPVGPRFPAAGADPPAGPIGPLPGWYALDVNHLHETPLSAADGRGGWQSVLTSSHSYGYFQRFQPQAMAGYSIHVYHITLEEANRVRRELALPALSGDEGPFQ